MAPKVEVQEHSCFGLQLSPPKVKDQKPNALGLQLLTPKVECQELNSTFYTIFFCLFYINLINLKFFLHSFAQILLENGYVFQVSFENKVDLILIGIPSNLPILHVFEPLSLIPPWNRWVDNFINSIMVFVERFLSSRKVIIIMHVDDSRVLK